MDNSSVTVKAGEITASGTAVYVISYDQSSASVTTGSATSESEEGAYVYSVSSQPTEATVNGDVSGGTYGLYVTANEGSAEVEVSVSGGVTGRDGYGVRANAYSGGDTEVTVGGDVTGSDRGIHVYSRNENSSSTVTVGKEGEDGGFTGSKVTGTVGDGIHVVTMSGGQADIKAGDVVGGENGVYADVDDSSVTVETGEVTGDKNGLDVQSNVTTGIGAMNVIVHGDVTGKEEVGIFAFSGTGDNDQDDDDSAATTVTVEGNVTGGKNGIYAGATGNSIGEFGTTTVTVGKSDKDGGFIGTKVTGGENGIFAEANLGGQIEIKTGDVEAGAKGVYADAKDENSKISVETGNINAKNIGAQITANGGSVSVTVEKITADRTGISAYTKNNGKTEATAGDIEAGDTGVYATADSGGTVTVETGSVINRSQYNEAIEVQAGTIDSAGTVKVTAGDITSTQGGMEVASLSDGSAEVTAQHIDAAGKGVEAEAGRPDYVCEFNGSPIVETAETGGNTTVTVTDGIKAGTTGVEALGWGGGVTTVAVQGGIEADGTGISAQGGNEAWQESEYSGNLVNKCAASTGSANVTVEGDITAQGNGIEAEAHQDGSAKVAVYGDVTGSDMGVQASTASGGSVSVLVDGTISGDLPVALAEGTAADSVSLTAWQITLDSDSNVVEQLDANGDVDSTAHDDESSAASLLEKTINYIVRVAATLNLNGENVGTLSAAKDADGAALDAVKSGDTTYQVAHEGDTVYYNMEYDTDKYEVDGAYTDEGQKVEAQQDENGNFFTKVLKGGGMLLNVLLKEKHVHSFTNYVSDGNATCTADGTKTAKCDRCDEKDTIADTGSKLGHSFTKYTSNNDATCTADGTKTAKCDRCDATDTVTDTGSKLGHSFTKYASNNDATCTADGTKTAKCDRCDVTDTIADEGSAKGHTVVVDAAVPATTTSTGLTEGSHCGVCGIVIVKQEVTPKLPAPAPEAHVHTVVEDAAVAATCTAAGKTAGSHCAACGEVLTAQKAIPALGHALRAWTPGAEAQHSAVCARCGVRVDVACQMTSVEADKQICAVCGRTQNLPAAQRVEGAAAVGDSLPGGNVTVMLAQDAAKDGWMTIAIERNGVGRAVRGTARVTLPADALVGRDLLQNGVDLQVSEQGGSAVFEVAFGTADQAANAAVVRVRAKDGALLTLRDTTGKAELTFYANGTFRLAAPGQTELGTAALKDGAITLTGQDGTVASVGDDWRLSWGEYEFLMSAKDADTLKAALEE